METLISKPRSRTSSVKQVRALKQTRISNYWLDAPVTAVTSNRYEDIEVEENEDESKEIGNNAITDFCRWSQ